MNCCNSLGFDRGSSVLAAPVRLSTSSRRAAMGSPGPLARVREAIRLLSFLPSNVAMKTFVREFIVGSVRLLGFVPSDGPVSYNGCIPASAEKPHSLNFKTKHRTNSPDCSETSTFPPLICESFVSCGTTTSIRISPPASPITFKNCKDISSACQPG